MESFWATEYGQDLMSMDNTPIDRLLSSPDTILEDLMDDEELLQQCSNKNATLISFLAREENITKLISYITRPHTEHLDRIVSHYRELEARSENENNDESTQNAPLSVDGIHSVSPIPEQAETDLNDSNNAVSNTESPEDSSHPTQSTEANPSNLEDDSKSTDPIPTPSNPPNQDHHDEPFDRYDDLKLSDDDEDQEEDQKTDDSKNDNDSNQNLNVDRVENSNDAQHEDQEAISILKRVKSPVEIALQGPDYVEGDSDEEPEPVDLTEPNNAADPELPEFEIGNEDEETVNIFDEEAPPPPPPPPPEQPSKLEDIQSESGVERVKLKFPYLASEIINCQIPQILDAILDEQRPFLDMLFDFIEQGPPLNAVLTNYWRSCIVGLVRRDSPVILKYIRRREGVLAALVQHIRDQSIMELVIALGWDPAIEELKELDEVADWMFDEQLVPQLISTLSPDHSPDEHSAASYTLVDIVAKTSRSTNLVLFHCLSSSVQIEGLMEHMFSGNRSSLLESLSVLLALLHHYPNVSAEKQQFGDENDIPPPPPTEPNNNDEEEDDHDGDEQMTENPLAPKSPENKDTEDVVVAADPMEVDENESKDSAEKMDEEHKEASATIPEPSKSTKPVEDVPPVVKAVCQRLANFKQLLQTAPSRDLELPFCRLSPPLGPVRHKVVDMIVALMRTPCTMVSEKLREMGLIKICIELFFEYPWNNLLHGSVEHIIQMVVSGDCDVLKRALFEDCDFLSRILKARQLSAKHQEERKFRLGFMGHITRVSNTIVEFAKRNQQLDDYMQQHEDWMQFIGEALKLENEQLNTQLGGHRPSAMNGDDGDDFTLFTLAEIGGVGSGTDGDGNNILDVDAEPDMDSDSDSDDEDRGNMNIDDRDVVMDNVNGPDTSNVDNYEMPQDVFAKLTEEMDLEAAKKGQVDNDEFNHWLQDDGDWEFGKDKVDKVSGFTEKKEELSNGVDTGHSDKNAADNTVNKENVEKDSSDKAQDDFANWDDDPFAADDDIFGADAADDKGTKTKESTQSTDESSALKIASKQIDNGVNIPTVATATD